MRAYVVGYRGCVGASVHACAMTADVLPLHKSSVCNASVLSASGQAVAGARSILLCKPSISPPALRQCTHEPLSLSVLFFFSDAHAGSSSRPIRGSMEWVGVCRPGDNCDRSPSLTHAPASRYWPLAIGHWLAPFQSPTSVCRRCSNVDHSWWCHLKCSCAGHRIASHRSVIRQTSLPRHPASQLGARVLLTH